MLNAIHFCCSEFGWNWEYTVNEISLINILLLMRQNAYNLGHKGITLSDQEMIDNSNWDELLKKNREKYCRYK